MPIKSFLYLPCNDLTATRRFYTDILGLEEIFFSSDDGTVGYRVGTLQLAVTFHSNARHVEGWAAQLGWEGGDQAAPSLGVEYASDAFPRVVQSIAATGIPTRFSEPQWVGYWSYPVKDPLGHTVEISTPDQDSWPPDR